MTIKITSAMARSLRDAAAMAARDFATGGGPMSPEICFDGTFFSYGSNLMRGDDEIEFVSEFDLGVFVENWFGTGSPSRFRVTDARHCIEQCLDELQDQIDALAE